MAAFSLKITEQMGFWKFASKAVMFKGGYNETSCGYTGIHMTLFNASALKYDRPVFLLCYVKVSEMLV